MSVQQDQKSLKPFSEILLHFCLNHFLIQVSTLFVHFRSSKNFLSKTPFSSIWMVVKILIWKKQEPEKTDHGRRYFSVAKTMVWLLPISSSRGSPLFLFLFTIQKLWIFLTVVIIILCWSFLLGSSLIFLCLCYWPSWFYYNYCVIL